jgi:RimJ/RimL family protein N-acetyltransferase
MHIDNRHRNAGLGYWLGKQYWRRGITKEALTLILDFDFNYLELVRIYAKVLPPNLPSIRLLQSAGFRYEDRMRKTVFRDGSWFDELTFALVDEDFKTSYR